MAGTTTRVHYCFNTTICNSKAIFSIIIVGSCVEVLKDVFQEFCLVFGSFGWKLSIVKPCCICSIHFLLQGFAIPAFSSKSTYLDLYGVQIWIGAAEPHLNALKEAMSGIEGDGENTIVVHVVQSCTAQSEAPCSFVMRRQFFQSICMTGLALHLRCIRSIE